ncbi:MAG: hypothetical protein AABX28_01430 [Nanoarchaeota archaeon]
MKEPYKVYHIGEAIEIPHGSGFVRGEIDAINADASYYSSIPPIIFIGGMPYYPDDFIGVEVVDRFSLDNSRKSLAVLVKQGARKKEPDFHLSI